MKKKSILLLPFLIFGMSLAGCGGGQPEPEPEPVEPEVIEVQSISLDKTSISILEGASETLKATVLPANATDNSVTWTSANASIAKVSNGTVTGVAKGETDITAKAGEKTAKCHVTVTAKAVEALTVSLAAEGEVTTLKVSQEVKLTATANKQGATFEWSQSGEGEVEITPSNGGEALVKGSKAGAVNVKVVAKVGTETAEKTLALTVETPVVGAWEAFVNGTKIATSQNPDNDKEVTLIEKELQANDLIYFSNAASNLGYAALKPSVEPDYINDGFVNFEAGQNGELKTINTGTYSFYVNIEDLNIWVVKKAEVQEDVYQAFLGENEITLADVSDVKGESDTWVKQFKGIVTVAKDNVISFKKNNEAYYPGVGMDNDNNVVINAETRLLTVLCDKTNAELYLKIYKDGGASVYLTGYVAPVQPTLADLYRLAYGAENAETWGWEHAIVGVLAESEAENVKEQVKFELTIQEATSFKIRGKDNGDNTEWYGTKYQEGVGGDTDNNIAIEAGKYEIFFKLYNDNGHSIQVVKEQQEDVYKAFLGENEIALRDVSDTKGESDTWVKQFKGVVTVAKDNVLTFKKNNEAYFPGAGTDANNNVSYNEETHLLTVLTAKENAELYLKIYKDGGAAVFLTGYQAPAQPTLADLYRLAYGAENAETWGWEHAIVGTVVSPENENVKEQVKFVFTTDVATNFKIRGQDIAGQETEWYGTKYQEGVGGDADNNIALEAGEYTIYFKLYKDNGHSIQVVNTLANLYRLAYGAENAETWGWEHAIVGTNVTPSAENVKEQVKFEITVQEATGFKIRNATNEWYGENFAEGNYKDQDDEHDNNIQLEAGSYEIFFKLYNDNGHSIEVVRKVQQ